MIERTTLLSIPGYTGSGPGHWQSLWEKDIEPMHRVHQADWDEPDPEIWAHSLMRAIDNHPAGSVLVAHSLGCVLIARWAATAAKNHIDSVRAAFLVAPADVDRGDVEPLSLASFGPIPVRALPFPSVLVASRNDPWLEFDRARELASAWGSTLVDAGIAGHINTASGHGPWPEGRAMLERLIFETSSGFNIESSSDKSS